MFAVYSAIDFCDGVSVIFCALLFLIILYFASLS